MTRDYDLVLAQARSLFDGERDAVANAANLAALIFGSWPDVSWSGFYFVRGAQLVLGPFQGKVACVRIARGSGVCGSAWALDRTLVVPDVHAFPGHIACDAASNSEIVVPIHSGLSVVGALDVDSTSFNRFGAAEQHALEALVTCYAEASDFSFLYAPLGLRP